MPTHDISRFELALDLALTAHAGQRDKQGQPYILHILRVALANDDTPSEMIVGLLHDVLEDTDTHMDALRDLLTPAEQMALVAITRIDREPYEAYIERVARDPIARLVKIQDLCDNLGRISGIRDIAERARLEARYEKALVRLRDR